ncbi:MAG TPA: metal ABC transporter substrate-binding protein [Nocardioides sp.]|uniref:metal ABC transporter substrate-binding protein n=1 Tax=Nocardioides sp. TaxID=35761 RepID=UPI002D0E3A35|nr:metal ABC transporter substrate-binding protein [Nocardioides sp.]HQR25570.1 metal ABC transporter substrate-binding protein [Nocardioides sp.]
MKWRRPGGVLALGAALAVLPLAGCGTAAPEQSGRPEVAAAFYPLAFVASRVAGDHADVVNLTRPGGEPHDLELTFTETVTVADADLVVLLGGFQPSVDETAANVAQGRVLDAASVVDLEPVHTSAGDEHDHGDLDPHFWQDPLRMAALADAVADQLAAIDPAHRDDYLANARRLDADLAALDAEYRSGLADCELDTVVVSHDAFGYLARYGLHFEAINELSPDAEPSPADLARLHELARDEGITTIFSESLASPELADTLAGELGVTTAVLDPVEGLSDATADEDYLSLMRTNLAALEEANRCSAPR